MPDQYDEPLTPDDRAALQRRGRFLVVRTTGEAMAGGHLPHRVTDPMVLRWCTVEAKLRADGALLAAVAPWALTARLAMRWVGPR